MLNIRQKAFCEYYVESGNATEAAKNAGYKEKYARENTSKLLQNTNILKYIEELREKSKSKRIMNATKRREWLTTLINNPDIKTNDRLKALDILNKMDGEYTEKIQVSGEINNPLESFTKEELEELLKK